MLPFGVGAVLALVSVPSPVSWLAPVPLAGLFLLIQRTPRPRAALAVGFWGGVGFFAVHLAWLPISFARLFGAVVIPPLLAVPFLLGAFWGLAAWFARLAGRRNLLALPFAWVVMEYLRSLGPFGFTWGTMGYALLPTPAVQVAELGGVYLVSLLATLSAAALAALAQRRWWPAPVMLAALVAATAYGLTRQAATGPERSILLVQGAVDPLRKAAGRSLDELELYASLSREGLAGARPAIDLIVWPEGASPLPLDDPRARRAVGGLRTPAIVGAPDYANGYQNAAYAFDGTVTGRYRKVKLVPFGERFPLRDTLAFAYDPVFRAIGLPGLISTTAGDAFTPLRLGDITAGTYICYESTFPQVARTMVARGANLLVNISNDAWFGRTQGAEQHFQMGRMRAIETRRYLVRAGNDGITAVITPRGRVDARYPRGARGAFEARVRLVDDTTPYVRAGDWVVAVSAAVALGLAGWAAADTARARSSARGA